MEIVKSEKGDSFPVKAMPEETRTKKVLELGIWLSKLLSLKDDKSAERLEVLLPMVSDFCWSMSIWEIKEAFTKYVKSELPSLEPRTNFLDVILFGKVIKAYKETRIKKPKPYRAPQLSKDEKENLIYLGLINSFKDYVQTKRVIAGRTWVYDHLDELKIISFTPEEKKNKMQYAKVKLKQEAGEISNVFQARKILNSIEEKNSYSVINEAKRLLLADFYEKLIRQEKHIKDYL